MQLYDRRKSEYRWRRAFPHRRKRCRREGALDLAGLRPELTVPITRTAIAGERFGANSDLMVPIEWTADLAPLAAKRR